MSVFLKTYIYKIHDDYSSEGMPDLIFVWIRLLLKRYTSVNQHY